jgi:hypothetical protein
MGTQEFEKASMAVGWFSARIEPNLSVTYIDHLVTPDVYEQYLKWLEEDIVTWPKERSPRGVLLHAPSSNKQSGVYRRRVGGILSAHEDRLAEMNAGFAMVTPSAVVRGFLKAIFWIAPPGYPTHVTSSVSDALEWLAPRMGTISAEQFEGEYQALLNRYRHHLSRSA